LPVSSKPRSCFRAIFYDLLHSKPLGSHHAHAAVTMLITFSEVYRSLNKNALLGLSANLTLGRMVMSLTFIKLKMHSTVSVTGCAVTRCGRIESYISASAFALDNSTKYPSVSMSVPPTRFQPAFVALILNAGHAFLIASSACASAALIMAD